MSNSLTTPGPLLDKPSKLENLKPISSSEGGHASCLLSWKPFFCAFFMAVGTLASYRCSSAVGFQPQNARQLGDAAFRSSSFLSPHFDASSSYGTGKLQFDKARWKGGRRPRKKGKFTPIGLGRTHSMLFYLVLVFVGNWVCPTTDLDRTLRDH